MNPDPLVIPWQGRQLSVRHDDPRTMLYSPQAARIRSVVELANDVEGLRLVLVSADGTGCGSARTGTWWDRGDGRGEAAPRRPLRDA